MTIGNIRSYGSLLYSKFYQLFGKKPGTGHAKPQFNQKLDKLPLEIIELVGSFLSEKDLRNLALTSSTTLIAASNTMTSRRISFTNKTPEMIRPQLQEVVNRILATKENVRNRQSAIDYYKEASSAVHQPRTLLFKEYQRVIGTFPKNQGGAGKVLKKAAIDLAQRFYLAVTHPHYKECQFEKSLSVFSLPYMHGLFYDPVMQDFRTAYLKFLYRLSQMPRVHEQQLTKQGNPTRLSQRFTDLFSHTHTHFTPQEVMDLLRNAPLPQKVFF